MTVAATGSTSSGAAALQVNVGRTLAFVSAAAGYPQTIGDPGAVQLVGGTPGDQVTIQPDRTNGIFVWVLLPTGETLQGTGQSSFRTGDISPVQGASATIVKVGPSTWERVL